MGSVLFVHFVLLPTVWRQWVMPSGNMTGKPDSAPGCRFGDWALLFDPDSDPEQEISVWTGQHQGEITFRIPLPKSTKWTL